MTNKRINGEKNRKYFFGGCWGPSLSNSNTEAEIDEIMLSERSTFNDALRKWGIDAREMKLINPVVITGPILQTEIFTLQNGQTRNKKLYRVGKDGQLRGYWNATYILGFTEKQAMLYVKKWNVYDHDVNVNTEEIFYKDIVSINVSEEIIDSTPYFKFTLNVPGSASFNSGLSRNSLEEKHIQALKTLIREKKSE